MVVLFNGLKNGELTLFIFIVSLEVAVTPGLRVPWTYAGRDVVEVDGEWLNLFLDLLL